MGPFPEVHQKRGFLGRVASRWQDRAETPRSCPTPDSTAFPTWDRGQFNVSELLFACLKSGKVLPAAWDRSEGQMPSQDNHRAGKITEAARDLSSSAPDFFCSWGNRGSERWVTYPCSPGRGGWSPSWNPHTLMVTPDGAPVSSPRCPPVSKTTFAEGKALNARSSSLPTESKRRFCCSLGAPGSKKEKVRFRLTVLFNWKKKILFFPS